MTRRSHAHHERRQDESLLSALRDPVVVTTTSGEIQALNGAAADLLGDPERLRGQLINAVLPFVVDWESEGARPGTGIGRLVDRHGRERDLEVSLVFLEDRGAGSRHAYVIRDVSQYLELNRAREQLLYAVAHELGSPIATLDNTLELLAEGGTLSVEEQARLLTGALRTTRRLRMLVDNLLSIGTIRAGRFLLEPRAVRLHEAVAHAVETVAVYTATRRQRVEIVPTDMDLAVHADPRYLHQVLYNLLSNASKYSDDGTAIAVRAARLDGNVRISVHDQGQGIPAELHQRLFDRFFRASPRSSQPGVGLGLAIVKGLVEAHGGTVGIESEMGVGSTVWFTLPCDDAPVASSNEP